VLLSIDLDDESFLDAAEVDDERADAVLASEVTAVETIGTEHPPEDGFGESGGTTHMGEELEVEGVHIGVTDENGGKFPWACNPRGFPYPSPFPRGRGVKETEVAGGPFLVESHRQGAFMLPDTRRKHTQWRLK
jgi:hypothetical protein